MFADVLLSRLGQTDVLIIPDFILIVSGLRKFLDKWHFNEVYLVVFRSIFQFNVIFGAMIENA